MTRLQAIVTQKKRSHLFKVAARAQTYKMAKSMAGAAKLSAATANARSFSVGELYVYAQISPNDAATGHNHAKEA